ncbi:MAG: GtrA family protein [Clostridiales bacterium]|nr:GtrA family protein [Clostridiales bacterium]
MKRGLSVNKKDNVRIIKFVLFSISAGVIEITVFTLLNELVTWPNMESSGDYGPNYFIALICSIIWNFTFNRKFTFKSIENVPVAMAKLFGYYCIFTPASMWWGIALTERVGLNEYLVLGLTMLTNLFTEYLVQRYFVYGKSLDTNERARKEKIKKNEEGRTN